MFSCSSFCSSSLFVVLSVKGSLIPLYFFYIFIKVLFLVKKKKKFNEVPESHLIIYFFIDLQCQNDTITRGFGFWDSMTSHMNYFISSSTWDIQRWPVGQIYSFHSFLYYTKWSWLSKYHKVHLDSWLCFSIFACLAILLSVNLHWGHHLRVNCMSCWKNSRASSVTESKWW